jgi:hypothetical protein
MSEGSHDKTLLPKTPATFGESKPPILNKQTRHAKLLNWAKSKYGDDPIWLPNRDQLKDQGRIKVAGNVNEEDARWLRKELLPKERTRGGAGFHKEHRPPNQA